MHGAKASGNLEPIYGINVSIRTTSKQLNYITLCIFHTRGLYVLFPELREHDYLEEKIQGAISAFSWSFPV
jgi:hypothetical protein